MIIREFYREFKNYCYNFDPDEHAEMWIKFRGKNGVPGSIRALIDDADAMRVCWKS